MKRWFCAAMVIVVLAANGGRTVRADLPIRVATFNIENFNPANTTQFNAARDILRRIDADIVCVQEIDLVSDFNQLATAAGYPSFRVLASGSNSFDGFNHAGIMSKYPFQTFSTQSSISLSGDSSARDLTRNFIVAEIVVPGAGENFVLVGNHWKSGTSDADEFRRSIEGFRTLQATLPYDSNLIPYVVVGDMNDDISDSADSPSFFNSEPGDLPVAFNLGNDIGFPLANGVFKPFQQSSGNQRLTLVQAFQLAGAPLDATRNASGRRLDYIWRSSAATFVAAEVYDSADEGLGGLPKAGDPLPAGTSAAASDHLPVFADLLIPDNQAGACCTACGCDDTLNETQCLAVGGAFRGAGVLCGVEVPACPVPPDNVRINEVLVTHDGTQDQEFVELVGDPLDLLCGLTIIVVEGEGLSKGRVDRTIPLDTCGSDTCNLDSNGYFVAGGSGLVTDLLIGSGVDVFENGTQTIALVRDLLVDDGDDVDTNNDGVVDVAVGTVLDAVAVVNGDYPSSDRVYFGAAVIGPDGTALATGGARCPNRADTDADADFVRLSRTTDGTDGCQAITPGSSNPNACGGDANGDGVYDLVDFAVVQRCYGQQSAACAAVELDGECGITAADFTLFEALLSAP